MENHSGDSVFDAGKPGEDRLPVHEPPAESLPDGKASPEPQPPHELNATGPPKGKSGTPGEEPPEPAAPEATDPAGRRPRDLHASHRTTVRNGPPGDPQGDPPSSSPGDPCGNPPGDPPGDPPDDPLTGPAPEEPAVSDLPIEEPPPAILVGSGPSAPFGIYVRQDALEDLRSWAEDSPHGRAGLLVGYRKQSSGGMYILITGVVEAAHAEFRPTSVRLTHESWRHMTRVQSRLHPGTHSLGWFHTHQKGVGRLSAYEEFVHQVNFGSPWQVALVTGDSPSTMRFFVWRESDLVPVEQFHVFAAPDTSSKAPAKGTSKTGTKASAKAPSRKPEAQDNRRPAPGRLPTSNAEDFPPDIPQLRFLRPRRAQPRPENPLSSGLARSVMALVVAAFLAVLSPIIVSRGLETRTRTASELELELERLRSETGSLEEQVAQAWERIEASGRLATPGSAARTQPPRTDAGRTDAGSNAPSTGSPLSTYIVRPGDTLWGISNRLLGDGRSYQRIAETNRSRVLDPDYIRPGWKLEVPLNSQSRTR